MSKVFSIENAEVSGLEQSVRAAGYPRGKDDYSEKRAFRLGKVPCGSAHDCYLKGIVVSMDVIAPQYWWLQFGRYHFADIVSSESKVHSLAKMEIRAVCNQYVRSSVFEAFEEIVNEYNEKDSDVSFQELMSNAPMGLMLRARVVTNFLQLKTMFWQRQHHKLEEWKVFCDWILTLPKFKEFVLGEVS